MNSYVAIESFRPHWDRLVKSGRVITKNHPTVDRIMRFDLDEGLRSGNLKKHRDSLSLKIVDQVLSDADEQYLLQQLYLVNRNGVSICKLEREEGEKKFTNSEKIQEKTAQLQAKRAEQDRKRYAAKKATANRFAFEDDDDGLTLAA